MFSKGTFNRYLFEIDSTHKKMLDLYQRLAGQLQDPEIRKSTSECADQVEAEQQVVSGIRAALQTAT
jgi:hypothetical protein